MPHTNAAICSRTYPTYYNNATDDAISKIDEDFRMQLWNLAQSSPHMPTDYIPCGLSVL